MAYTMTLPNVPSNQDRELNIQQLDPSKLSDGLEWDIYSQTGISFRHIVEENPLPRSDALRFKMIADVNIDAARSSFSRLCSSTTLFKIPHAVKCDRTFARDAYDAYYLDAMYSFLEENSGELRMEDLPLLRVPLHNRYFCAFSKRPTYYNEVYERRRLKHWIPGDYPELEHFSDLQKAAWFPKVESWLHLIHQPPALPIPTPPSIYYHHNELRNAQRFPNVSESERIKRLQFCAKGEYHILFLSTWWNDLIRGGRAFFVHPNTINVLDEQCGHISDIVGKPAQAIIERMRIFSHMPRHFHNWICFTDKMLEASPFIFAIKNSGTHDHTLSCGRRIWCRRDHRSLTVSRYSSSTYKRLTLLGERLSGPELDEVPGLLSLVKEQDWARYNSLRVCELLQNLTGLYNQTRSVLDETKRRLAHEERCHGDIEKDLYATRDEVAYLKYRLDDSNRALNAANQQNDILGRKLDDANREVDSLKRNRTTGASWQHPHQSRAVRTEHGFNYVDGITNPHLHRCRDVPESELSYHPAQAPTTTGNNRINLEIPRVRGRSRSPFAFYVKKNRARD